MAEEILIVAGEASADLHAAGALEELARLRPTMTDISTSLEKFEPADLRDDYSQSATV